MKVNNKKTIRHIGFNSLMASRKRNIIAILAIAVTSILFTVLFTMLMSLVSSYEISIFKQIGGYSHGSFKEVTKEQAEKLSGHNLVKESGERIVIGSIYTGAFKNKSSELSYMDNNCAKWSYAEPTTGKLPEKINEIAMDTGALTKLGVEPSIGTKIHLDYEILGKEKEGEMIEGDFILSGFWEYDPSLPVHYINISKDYVDEISRQYKNNADGFRRDINVMMKSELNIEKQMINVITDLGYECGDKSQENVIRMGVNWGYESQRITNTFDFETIVAVLAFAVLIIFTGYLIIYNIFQISVVSDIRFYGLLKTIGVTKKQLKYIIRYQAMLLCVVAIPLGLILGYFIGMILTPVMLSVTSFSGSSVEISSSPLIFIFSVVFSLVTVLISSNRPGKIAGKVSPIEAVRYTEVNDINKKEKRTQKAGTFEMAMANLGRNKGETAIVLISLSLSVVLLTLLYSFIIGFDMDKFVESFSPIDFIVGDYEYFNQIKESNSMKSMDEINKVAELFDTSLSGRAYQLSGQTNEIMSYDQWYYKVSTFYSDEEIEEFKKYYQTEDGMYCDSTMIEAFDRDLFSKFTVFEGDIESLYEEDSHNIAINVYLDDYGNECDGSDIAIGDKVRIVYEDEVSLIDKLTGEEIDIYSQDVNMENVKKININNVEPHEVVYTVTAKLSVPQALSERYSIGSNKYVLTKEALEADSKIPLNVLYYAFDAKDENVVKDAEDYLQKLTVDGNNSVKYESTLSIEKEFYEFKNMFAIIGGALCITIGFIGALNFLNTVTTSMLARQKELAVLQAVGMTGKQVRKMLVFEGLLYTVGALTISFIIALVMMPLSNNVFEKMFWFYSNSFSFLPIILMLPIFIILGVLIPIIMYKQFQKKSVVERLTAVEY